MYKRTIFISSVHDIDRQCAVEAGTRISESRRWVIRSCKQLTDIMTERKNLIPNSVLRAERGCTPT